VNYVIDPFSSLVVLISDDPERVELVAQTYANQVGHGVLVANGPDPAGAQFLPIVPALVTPGVTRPINIELLPSANSGEPL